MNKLIHEGQKKRERRKENELYETMLQSEWEPAMTSLLFWSLMLLVAQASRCSECDK